MKLLSLLLVTAGLLGLTQIQKGTGAAVTSTIVQTTGVNFPAALTFAADGSMFWGEQYNGKIWYKAPGVVNTDKNATLHFTIPNLVAKGELGLLGLAAHPDWPTTKDLFAYATVNPMGFIQNVIYKVNATGAFKIWSVRAMAGRHHGGHMKIHNGYLWVQVGDDAQARLSQVTTTDRGKILVMKLDGSPPGAGKKMTHPLNSRHYARGFRNGFGMAFDPINSRLWATDNGPSCNDEINLVDLPNRASSVVRNLGWGRRAFCNKVNPKSLQASRSTNMDGPNPKIYPRRFWAKPIAVTAIAFPANVNASYLYFGNFKSPAKIRKLQIDPSTRAHAQAISDIDLPDVPGIIGIYTIERRPTTGDLYFSCLTETGGKIVKLNGA